MSGRPKLDALRRVFVPVVTVLTAAMVVFVLALARLPGWAP